MLTTTKITYAEQAKELHYTAAKLLQKIAITQECLAESILYDMPKLAETCSKDIDRYGREYADVMQKLIQPTIDKILKTWQD